VINISGRSQKPGGRTGKAARRTGQWACTCRDSRFYGCAQGTAASARDFSANRQRRHPRKGAARVGAFLRTATPVWPKIGTAEEPVLDRAIELAGAQSWGDG
jgi:hypothetical protein